MRLGKEILIFITLFFGLSLFGFWLLNGGAYAQELRYYLFLRSPLADQDLKTGQILKVAEAGLNIEEISSLSPNYRLFIPKIGVEAPIILPKSDTTEDILAGLEEGVGLYPDSALPGTPGRGVLLGHSSRASWYRGNYATIFTLLSKLDTGDEFIITNGSQSYRYLVFDRQVLSPDDTNELLANPADSSELALITCYPIGSSSQRTVVQAKLVGAE